MDETVTPPTAADAAATTDSVVAVLRHAAANHLVVMQAGIEMLESGDLSGRELTDEATARLRRLLSQRESHPEISGARAERMLWVLHILLVACSAVGVARDTTRWRISARGRVRENLVAWAHHQAATHDAVLGLTDDGAEVTFDDPQRD
jgi:hypothetical protein